MRIMHDLKIFIAAARLQNLTQVAHQLNLTPAATSAAIKRLEQQVGAELFVRSTRSLRLTKAGDTFLAYCQQGVDQIDEGIRQLQQQRQSFSGQLQLSVPSDLGRNLLLNWLDEFGLLHPDLHLRLYISDRLTDLYKHPVDVAIRYGHLADSSMVALPLCAENYRVLCAAPDYIAQCGELTHPLQLAEHRCLCFMLRDSTHTRWQFRQAGNPLSIDIKGDYISDDGDVVRRWAVAGRGIAFKSLLDVSEDLLSGKLRVLCADWQGESAPLSLLVPGRQHLTPVVMALRDFLTQKLQQQFDKTLTAGIRR